MNIIGINAFHPDSSACLIVDGKLIAAIAEERLGKRVKHVAGFPSEAIKKVCSIGNIGPQDIHYVTIGHNKWSNFSHKVLNLATSSPLKVPNRILNSMSLHRNVSSLKSMIAQTFELDEGKLSFKVKNIEHHLSHLASSYYCSDFEDAAGFSYDGSGDNVSGMYAKCSGNKIEIIKKIYMPHSLGSFYTAICQFIGFDQFGEEYKVMGLGAFGKPVFLPDMRKIASYKTNGEYHISSEYIHPSSDESIVNMVDNANVKKMYTDKLIDLFGKPRIRGSEITQREMDLAASCQLNFEEITLQCVNWLADQVPSKNIITAGGCALNGVCNAKIREATRFKNSYIQCAASDDGTAIGSAQYVWHHILKNPRNEGVDHAYFGPEYSDESIEKSLIKSNLPYVRFSESELLKQTAKYLNSGKVIGWYQGRSEWGPRALGNRSILAHPGWPKMKETINLKIKRRESFRPFAPSILEDRVSDYFEQDIRSPFMMHVVKIRELKRVELAAVCHEDFTGRLHTVKRSQNRLYYDLISEFCALSGTPVVLNTSFNENEPIVDTPDQAISCFQRNDVDVLCIGNFISLKNRNK
jgi:carbamoyltransferase